MLALVLLLTLGFLFTSLASYQVSKSAIRQSIVDRELPLTTDNIFSEIQKDLIRPVFVSSMMASDTFLRDWVLGGERDVSRVTRYLDEIKRRYGAVTSFFISERSGRYYYPGGILKTVSRQEPRDVWYYRVRALSAPYEINVDFDQAHGDDPTIFVNYRVLDFDGRFIGVAGIGLTVEAVRRLIGEYQERYRRVVYFVDPAGKIVLFGNHLPFAAANVREVPGLARVAQQALRTPSGSYEYMAEGGEHLLNTRFVPELNWYLFVEKTIDDDLGEIRRVLGVNLAISAGITLVVILLARLAVGGYQSRLEEMATVDGLTGLLNRQSSELMLDQAARELRRQPAATAVLLMDIDRFKAINDRYGHLAGDRVIEQVAKRVRASVREIDVAGRWGGEEFLVLLKGCGPDAAKATAEKLVCRVADSRISLPEGEISVTVSIGVAEFRADDTPESVVARADGGLYAAKEQGRNRVCLARMFHQTGPDSTE